MTHRGPGDLGQTGNSLASGPEVGDVQKVFVCTKRPKVDTPSPCFSPLRSGSELCAAPRAGPPSPTAVVPPPRMPWSPVPNRRGPPSPTAVVPLHDCCDLWAAQSRLRKVFSSQGLVCQWNLRAPRRPSLDGPQDTRKV